MEEKELKIKIDKQIKKIMEMIKQDSSSLEIKENQRILNKLLSEYLKEK